MDAQPPARPSMWLTNAILAVIAVAVAVMAATSITEYNARRSYQDWQRERIDLHVNGKKPGESDEQLKARGERLIKQAVENGPTWASYGLLADGNK